MLHLFPSANGNLYFHEVGSADAAVYYCMVKLMPPTGVAIGTFQPPARVSMAIEMEVTDSGEIWRFALTPIEDAHLSLILNLLTNVSKSSTYE